MSGGLPGIYKREREQRALANAPLVAKANSEEIAELRKWIAKLEKDVQALKEKTKNDDVHTQSGL